VRKLAACACAAALGVLGALAFALGPAGPRPAAAPAATATGTATRSWVSYPDQPAALPGPAESAHSAAGNVTSAGSLNWAGYGVSRHAVTFRAVRAVFFVPYLNCAASPGPTLSSAWAGLDGLSAHADSVEQTGIAANCSAAGKASYFAWFEMFPYSETKISMKIHPGDSVTASVSYSAARREFVLTLTDSTRHEHFTRDRKCPHVKVSGKLVQCPRSSAEIIAEAPATGSSQHLVIAPLSDYGAISFAGISITDSAGQQGGVLSRHWNALRITQLRASGGPVLAQPTPVAAATMFDVYWLRED
jgi:hypothetical protein